jgi:hypothetical protein
MNSATKVLIQYVADFKRKIDRSSYQEATHDKRIVLTTLLIENIADLKRKIDRSSYQSTTQQE